jgi:hypothetical protein
VAELPTRCVDPVREGCTSTRHPSNGLIRIITGQYPIGRDHVTARTGSGP